jgi:hypothetical protein
LHGTARAEIQRITGISSGALSNIIADFKKQLDGYDPEAIKDFCTKISGKTTRLPRALQDLGLKKLINEVSDDREQIEAYLSSLHKRMH